MQRQWSLCQRLELQLANASDRFVTCSLDALERLVPDAVRTLLPWQNKFGPAVKVRYFYSDFQVNYFSTTQPQST